LLPWPFDCFALRANGIKSKGLTYGVQIKPIALSAPFDQLRTDETNGVQIKSVHPEREAVEG